MSRDNPRGTVLQRRLPKTKSGKSAVRFQVQVPPLSSYPLAKRRDTMRQNVKLLWPVLAITLFLNAIAGYAADTKSPADQRSRSANPSNEVTAGKKLDLNTATLEQLESLPGVGSVTAHAIINARPFKSVNELTN